MSEKKLWELQIDAEFRDLIPPLQEDELSLLEESIVTNGCESPLIVWNGAIVDGHNRYAICHKHAIPFKIQEREFESREDAMLWMIRNQLGRRNLNGFQRAELVLKYEPMLAEEARKRSGTRTDLGKNSARGSKLGRTAHQLAEMAGVSHDTVKKVKKLVADADEETKSDLRKGKVSVHKAYSDLMTKERGEEKKVCDRCHEEKPFDEFSIPSKHTEFSCLCKACEKEIAQTAKDAAEVASKTTTPVEVSPIPGMVMHKGAPIHVETPMPDNPEMFQYILDLVQSAATSYIVNLQAAMRRYTNGMSVPGGNEQLMEIVKNTNAQAVTILSERMKGE